MFAGNDENQWLDQVKEEFGSNLLEHNDDDGNGNGSNTMIVMDKNAKESLAKEMKEKDYDLKGIDSRASKRTHHTDMTGRTGATSTCLVTTKKHAMDFIQQKTDLNVEGKKNALLEQKLREMEALATGRISSTSKEIISISNGDSTNTAATLTKTITITTLAFGKAQVLAEETFTQLILPPTPSKNSAIASSTTMGEVGRWD